MIKRLLIPCLFFSSGAGLLASANTSPIEEVVIESLEKKPVNLDELAIVVPLSSIETGLKIAITGCVVNQGIFYLKAGTDVEAAIQKAGGRTKLAYAKEIIITNYQTGRRMTIRSKKEPTNGSGPVIAERLLICEGDIIFIPMIM